MDLTAFLQDPQIRTRVLQLLVYFSTTALDGNANFMLKVLEHILMTWPATEPENRDYNESIKELQSESTLELQRLALEMPDNLLVGRQRTYCLAVVAGSHSQMLIWGTQTVYDQLESRVREMISSGTLDDKRTVAYRSFLFIIV